MKEEVQCACELFSKLLETRNLPRQFVQPFRARLGELLAERFKEHWDTKNPTKGSGYRCIRINSKMDPLVNNAAKATGLQDISKYLPVELTMWIDPGDVSYRIGEDGSVCSLSTNVVKRSESYLSPSNGRRYNTREGSYSPPLRASSSPVASSSSPHYYHHRGGQSYNRGSPVSRLVEVQV